MCNHSDSDKFITSIKETIDNFPFPVPVIYAVCRHCERSQWLSTPMGADYINSKKEFDPTHPDAALEPHVDEKWLKK